MTINKHTVDETVLETLHSVRTLLGMEVAFISEFKGGRRIFRHVDSDNSEIPVQVGASDPLEDSYCQRVVDGRLPELIQDARRNPEALTLPATEFIPVGAHLSVPIRFGDGHIYGTFCCFSRTADHTLNDRDIRAMRLFADVTAKYIEEQVVEENLRQELMDRHEAVLKGERFAIVYQPIVDIARGRVIGYEALTRFLDEPIRTPDAWFKEAAQIGLQEELELAAIRKALRGLSHFPDDTYLSINASPETILAGALDSALVGHPYERLMLEVTEHVSVDDYSRITAILEPMRKRGLRLAIDDAGAGFASFRHILKLKADVIKLDNSLIRQIDTNTSSRALAAALVRFAEETDSKVVAEGVETEAELNALRDLRVNNAQGYLLGRPAPIEIWRQGRQGGFLNSH